MIDWNTLILHIVDGPGAGITWICLAIIAAGTIRYTIRWMNRWDDAFERGKKYGMDQAMITRQFPAE